MAKQYARKAQLAERYACTIRNIDLLVKAQRLPPPSMFLGRLPLWDMAALDEHDRRATVERTPTKQSAA